MSRPGVGDRGGHGTAGAVRPGTLFGTARSLTPLVVARSLAVGIGSDRRRNTGVQVRDDLRRVRAPSGLRTSPTGRVPQWVLDEASGRGPDPEPWRGWAPVPPPPPRRRRG